jgi:predicted helicase
VLAPAIEIAQCLGAEHGAAVRSLQTREFEGRQYSPIDRAADFWTFSQAGRDLAELHLNYETVPMYAGAKLDTGGKKLTDADYHVVKMKYGKSGKVKDLTTLTTTASGKFGKA